MREKVAIGTKYNNILVIKILDEYHIEPTGKKRRKVLVQCDCGEQFKIISVHLYRKGQKCPQCRFNQNSIVSIGQAYDSLTVIGFTLVNNKKQAICKCKCGTTINRRPELLTNNTTNNCGCKPRGNWKGVGQISKTILNRIKRNAKVRNISFEIDINYIWELYNKQNAKCALTGLNIGFGKKTTDTNEASLDRIDSNQGYIKGNIQWVHKDIQKMKMDLDENRFFELCKLVAIQND